MDKVQSRKSPQCNGTIDYLFLNGIWSSESCLLNATLLDGDDKCSYLGMVDTRRQAWAFCVVLVALERSIVAQRRMARLRQRDNLEPTALIADSLLWSMFLFRSDERRSDVWRWCIRFWFIYSDFWGKILSKLLYKQTNMFKWNLSLIIEFWTPIKDQFRFSSFHSKCPQKTHRIDE